MKKTLIAMATLSTILTAQAGAISPGITSSGELIEEGNALLVDKRTRVKLYPEISVSDSLRGTGINVIEQNGNPQDSHQVETTETVVVEEIVEVREVEALSNANANANENENENNDNSGIIKRTGEFNVGDAKAGYTASKTEKVYTKSFLGIPYAPIDVVVEKAKPIYFGNLYFNNLTCASGYNNGKIDLYSNNTTSLIPIKFCPLDVEAKIELNVQTFDDDYNNVVIFLGGQKIKVEKGYTTLYNLRYDDNNVVNLEFIYQRDEHPIRY